MKQKKRETRMRRNAEKMDVSFFAFERMLSRQKAKKYMGGFPSLQQHIIIGFMKLLR
jgi:hypothetical protein